MGLSSPSNDGSERNYSLTADLPASNLTPDYPQSSTRPKAQKHPGPAPFHAGPGFVLIRMAMPTKESNTTFTSTQRILIRKSLLGKPRIHQLGIILKVDHSIALGLAFVDFSRRRHRVVKAFIRYSASGLDGRDFGR